MLLVTNNKKNKYSILICSIHSSLHIDIHGHQVKKKFAIEVQYIIIKLIKTYLI